MPKNKKSQKNYFPPPWKKLAEVSNKEWRRRQVEYNKKVDKTRKQKGLAPLPKQKSFSKRMDDKRELEKLKKERAEDKNLKQSLMDARQKDINKLTSTVKSSTIRSLGPSAALTLALLASLMRKRKTKKITEKDRKNLRENKPLRKALARTRRVHFKENPLSRSSSRRGRKSKKKASAKKKTGGSANFSTLLTVPLKIAISANRNLRGSDVWVEGRGKGRVVGDNSNILITVNYPNRDPEDIYLHQQAGPKVYILDPRPSTSSSPSRPDQRYPSTSSSPSGSSSRRGRKCKEKKSKRPRSNRDAAAPCIYRPPPPWRSTAPKKKPRLIREQPAWWEYGVQQRWPLPFVPQEELSRPPPPLPPPRRCPPGKNPQRPPRSPTVSQRAAVNQTALEAQMNQLLPSGPGGPDSPIEIEMDDSDDGGEARNDDFHEMWRADYRQRHGRSPPQADPSP